ncbi:MAG: NADH-quinone oxidoreductase subunit C [Saprospiraceae bacterium]|nr:NADH-quinone oxidoreductase subunit C [Saprospiraceae bacterium]
MEDKHQEFIKFIQTNWNDSIHFEVDQHRILNSELQVNQVYSLINFLYKDLQFKVNNLIDLCGIHFPDQKGKELGVIYHLQSLRIPIICRLKVFVPVEKPEVPSITGIYASANWMERETYDFYGIQFLGHPNLRRILNMDEMIDFPLRKEFPLEDPFRADKEDFHFGR